jgi:hypothetical protein
MPTQNESYSEQDKSLLRENIDQSEPVAYPITDNKQKSRLTCSIMTFLLLSLLFLLLFFYIPRTPHITYQVIYRY